MRSVVRVHPGPQVFPGAVAQLGERQLCKLDVVGSIPISSTKFVSRCFADAFFEKCIRRVEIQFQAENLNILGSAAKSWGLGLDLEVPV